MLVPETSTRNWHWFLILVGMTHFPVFWSQKFKMSACWVVIALSCLMMKQESISRVMMMLHSRVQCYCWQKWKSLTELKEISKQVDETMARKLACKRSLSCAVARVAANWWSRLQAFLTKECNVFQPSHAEGVNWHCSSIWYMAAKMHTSWRKTGSGLQV